MLNSSSSSHCITFRDINVTPISTWFWQICNYNCRFSDSSLRSYFPMSNTVKTEFHYNKTNLVWSMHIGCASLWLIRGAFDFLSLFYFVSLPGAVFKIQLCEWSCLVFQTRTETTLNLGLILSIRKLWTFKDGSIVCVDEYCIVPVIALIIAAVSNWYHDQTILWDT